LHNSLLENKHWTATPTPRNRVCIAARGLPVPSALLQAPAAQFADIPSRVDAYRAGRDPAADLLALYDRIAAEGESPVWISLLPRERALDMLADAAARLSRGEHLPLVGIPFAVKDNIDVAGLPTTAACPQFAFVPQRSAFAVERLVGAGAILIGKTNLDQFATGLNGTRSPYGVPSCVFNESYVSGGSSSGSAVAVACGLVPFALGTDTAGSGRVPAGFNNIVGLKPTKGLVSTRGVLPACRTQDCVSVFAASVEDARLVAALAAGFDPEDPYARKPPGEVWSAEAWDSFRFGIIGPEVLARCSPDVASQYENAVARLEALDGKPHRIDYAPFEEAASLLYSGPWVAERLAAIHSFALRLPEAIHPAVREVVLAGGQYSAVESFKAQYRLAALVREVAPVWDAVDHLLLPMAPDHPSIAAMLADPIELNSRLGLFTNFVNLMDLAAVAVPAGWTRDGLPVGVTLIGPAFSDGLLALLADRFHRADPQARLAASSLPVTDARAVPAVVHDEGRIMIAVVGAHLRGQPLNHQLLGAGAVFRETARTARGYSLYHLEGTVPPKPGLVRDGGAGLIEVELWSMSRAAFGGVVGDVPPPLSIGTLELSDGRTVKGFLCEVHAVQSAIDITAYGGWRDYLASTAELV
jgi:allophanate hydrolase